MLLHAGVGVLLLAVGSGAYTMLSPHREVQRIRDGNAAAAVSLAGAPVLNAAGEVTGMLLADEPRRGRLRATTPEALVRALAAARLQAGGAQPGQPITLDNYGRAADALRRDLSVAEVVCLAG
jgi:hypothetical protein